MLRDRLKTSAVLISIVLVLLTLDYRVVIPGAEGIWLLPLLLFFAVGTAWEMATMMDAGGTPIRRGVAVTGAVIVSVSAAFPFLWALGDEGYPADCPVGRLGWIVLGASLAVFLSLLAEMREYGKAAPDASAESDAAAPVVSSAVAGEAVRRTCSSVFVSVYVGLPMAMMIALRSLGASESSGRFGLAALVTMIIVTKVADSGAYFSGRALGRNKLIPRLSPGKTIEGAIGGVLASTLVAWLCLRFLIPWVVGEPAGGLAASEGGLTETTGMSELAVKTGLEAVLASPVWGAMLLGPMLAVTGMIGDLAESLFKRDCGVKDSGKLLPGLGGVWDVTDSLIAASVPAFFCFAAGVGG